MKPTTAKLITMPCDIESRRPESHRKAAWHRDCPYPEICSCPAHKLDSGKTERTAER